MSFKEKITAIDLHACGEPGRVITGGVSDVPGRTMFEKKVWFEQNADALRKRMLREPRGYPAANCNLLLPPTNPRAHAGFIIMEQAEYPPMSGTNTICVVTALIEAGIVQASKPHTVLLLDTPAGLVQVEALVRDGKVTQVTFENVPAFATHLHATIEVPHLGSVTVDVAYGGMFYVIAEAAPLGLRLTPDEGRDIVRIGEMIKAAACEQLLVEHPCNPDIRGISIAELTAPPTNPAAAAKNAVIVSTGKLDWNKPSTWTGALDRSPCGTGTCARMAVLHATGKLHLHEPFPHEGILGTIFTGHLVGETSVGKYPAVVPKLSGSAWITGFAEYVIDPEDPFPEGFTVGDIWGAGTASKPAP
jgi:proline racemase